jgi:methionine-rich copper-binding protein CopC
MVNSLLRRKILLAGLIAINELSYSQATVIAVDPAPGSAISAPAEVSIVFSEHLSAQTSNIYVVSSSGTPVTRASASIDPDNRAHMVLPLPKLQAGTYSVHWVALGVDGRRTENEYRFRVTYPMR